MCGGVIVRIAEYALQPLTLTGGKSGSTDFCHAPAGAGTAITLTMLPPTQASPVAPCRSRRTECLRVHHVSFAIARAGRFLQARVVEDRDRAAAIVDQPLLLQRARGVRYSYAPHTEHVRQELVRKMKLISMSTVATHQQPAGKSRLHQVITGASSRLRELPHQHVHIATQSLTQLGVASVVPRKGRCAHPQCSPCALDHGVLRRAIHTENERRAEHAFVTDDSDFQPCSVIQSRHQGDEALGREVHVTDLLAQRAKDLGKTQFDLLAAG